MWWSIIFDDTCNRERSKIETEMAMYHDEQRKEMVDTRYCLLLICNARPTFTHAGGPLARGHPPSPVIMWHGPTLKDLKDILAHNCLENVPCIFSLLWTQTIMHALGWGFTWAIILAYKPTHLEVVFDMQIPYVRHTKEWWKEEE